MVAEVVWGLVVVWVRCVVLGFLSVGFCGWLWLISGFWVLVVVCFCGGGFRLLDVVDAWLEFDLLPVTLCFSCLEFGGVVRGLFSW